MRWVPPGPAFLFCPADRPERFEKAARSADVVILDLEDAVAPDRRTTARAALRSADLDSDTTIVRLNPSGTDDHQRDVDALRDTNIRMVMLAKASSANDVSALAPFEVLGLCETPRGVHAAYEIAACANSIALMWGSEDLVAALGGYASRAAEGSLRDLARYARAKILVDAGANGLGALDTTFLDFGNLEGLRRDAEDAAALGFMATACIHPSQVAVVRDAYRPSDDQVIRAKRVVEAAATYDGVFRLDDVMVDGPMIAQARQILRRAGEGM
ncbi:MAG: CoA ester lyase [Acidimicrobiaceae bacterium]|nr:CoA ester lyase [Acidimicrobiaceae bacterium]